MKRKYAVIFEQAETNWAAYVPDLPGCVTTGRTLEETERNIREAIPGHLQTLRDFGEPVPEPTSVAKEIEVSPAAQATFQNHKITFATVDLGGPAAAIRKELCGLLRGHSGRIAADSGITAY